MSTLQLDHVSRWYRNVVAVNDVSMTIRPGDARFPILVE